MKVILLQDVKSVGKKDDIVEVSNGYANNMLIPRKLAVEATPKNLNDLKMRNRHAEKVAKEQLEAAEELAGKLEGKSVQVRIKAGENGRAFGSVSTKEIAAAVKEQLGLEVDKRKMVLAEPIKNIGVYQVKLKLHAKVSVMLEVDVLQES